jgi:NitT/TauT family transport system permease protein
VLAAILAVPLGSRWAHRPIGAFFEPFVSFARLPASAFIPLLILWAGIGDCEAAGDLHHSFFQLVLMVAVIVGNARTDLVERPTRSARGHGHRQRVLLPRPTSRNLRLVLGWAWTYVIVLTDRILVRHRPHDHRQPGLAEPGQIIFRIIVIG